MGLEDRTSRPTVFIVEDDVAMRDSLRELVGVMRLDTMCFDSAESFLEAYDPDWNGCLVLDIRMPGMSGIELHNHLVSRGVALPVIIITGHGDISMCAESMRKGAMDFLEKPYRPAQLTARIRQAIQFATESRAEQERYLDFQKRFDSLDSQETEILKSIVAGERNKEIAETLDISLRTLQFRRASIMQKLGVETRPELVKLVTEFRNNLISKSHLN